MSGKLVLSEVERIEQKVLNFVNLHNLLPDGARVLLAVSGGADSVALLEILVSLKLSGGINNDFHIAHINHQLRGQMCLEDEKFVKALAEKYELPITVEQIDVKKYAQQNSLSIETAARFLRLKKLTEIAKKNNCPFIATAHQKNDNAETIIHRLLRGTAFKGLAGIRPKMVLNLSAGALAKADGTTFVRPLLCLRRNEIEDYLVSQNIKWQTDHTNLDCRFTRNRIRHRLLPMLQRQSYDDLVELLFILSQKGPAFSDKIEKQAKAVWKECIVEQSERFISVDTNRFNSYPSLLKVEIIQNALQQCGIGLQKITNEHYNRIIKFLIDARTGKILQLPNKTLIKKNRKIFYLGFPQNHLVRRRSTEGGSDKPLPVQLKIQGSVCFSDWIIETEILPADKINIENIKLARRLVHRSFGEDGKNKNNFIEWFDLGQIKQPLIARGRQKGDKFKPFGLVVSKKIGKFITSAKLDLDHQKKTFLVCDSEKILWLVPVRRSSEALMTNTSKSLLQIKIKNASK